MALTDALGKLQGLVSRLTGKMPILLDVNLQDERRSRALSALLAQHLGKKHFGELHLCPGFATSADHWAAQEATLTKTIMAQLNEVSNVRAA